MTAKELFDLAKENVKSGWITTGIGAILFLIGLWGYLNQIDGWEWILGSGIAGITVFGPGTYKKVADRLVGDGTGGNL